MFLFVTFIIGTVRACFVNVVHVVFVLLAANYGFGSVEMRWIIAAHLHWVCELELLMEWGGIVTAHNGVIALHTSAAHRIRAIVGHGARAHASVPTGARISISACGIAIALELPRGYC